jgi:ferrous iron transport protein A
LASSSPAPTDRLPLEQLPTGQSGVLLNGGANGTASSEISLRLRNLGFVPDTEIRVLRRAPFGGPIEFELRGYRICLRREDLSGLQVSLKKSLT